MDGSRLLRVCCALPVLLALLSACAPGASQRTDGGERPAARPAAVKRIVGGVRGTPQVLYAKLNIASSGLGVADMEKLVAGGLAIMDHKDTLQAQLAEAVPSLENGLWKLLPDGRMEMTWRIRPNAAWHDGTPFRTDDLLFTWRVVQDRELPVFRSTAFDFIEAIEASDPLTVTITWRKPYIDATNMFSLLPGAPDAVPMPKHLLEQPYTEDKANFLQHPYWNSEFVGTGPFKLKEYVRDDHLVLQTNEQYVLGRPKIDEIMLRFIPDTNTLIANLLAGQVEMTFDTRSVTFAQGLQMQDQWRDGTMALDRAVQVVMFPQFLNPTPPQMTDVRFRRALLHAANRQEIADTVQAGRVAVAHSWIGPDSPDYPHVEKSIVRYEFDPRRATQLLEEVGFVKGGDGFYQDTAGQRLNVEIRTSATDINQKSSFAMQDNWQRAGIGAEVATVPAQRTNEREYRATFPGVELIRPSTGGRPFESLHSSLVPLPENNWAGNNRSRYRSAELDALSERYFATIPPAERMQVLNQIVYHISDQVVQMGVVFDPPIRLISNRLVNVGAHIPWNSHEWDVR